MLEVEPKGLQEICDRWETQIQVTSFQSKTFVP